MESIYMNRELSWLKFNARVLEEAESQEVPLCERMTFVSIYQSNLDEFFMVRVGSLQDQMLLDHEIRENKTNMTSEQQVKAILQETRDLDQKKAAIYEQLMGELEPDEGSFKWGVTISTNYFPKDNSKYFDGCNLNMMQWFAQYSPEQLETYMRGFLGRMLFSGDDVYKPVSVLSGGEKVRVMLSRMMLSGANFLMLDQPTNHLDLESITAVNNALINFPGNVIFTSQDHQFITTIADRIIEIKPDGTIADYYCGYEDYLEKIRAQEG